MFNIYVVGENRRFTEIWCSNHGFLPLDVKIVDYASQLRGLKSAVVLLIIGWRSRSDIDQISIAIDHLKLYGVKFIEVME